MSQQADHPVLPFEISEDHTNDTISIAGHERFRPQEGLPANEAAPNQSMTGPVRRTKQKVTANLAAASATPGTTSAEEKAAGRIRISPTAVAAFEYVYAIERKPNEALIRVLSQSFGETFARVKVWFQNRRGRDTREKGGSGDESGPASGSLRRAHHQLPSSVLQTLLSQQKQQNPHVANELQQSLAASTGSTDLAGTTAQALNAMLTVSSISKFWGHHNHMLAGELITQEGERLALSTLKDDERVKRCPIVMALLERVIELRQGVIDQFVMTDNLIREVLPLEKPDTDQQIHHHHQQQQQHQQQQGNLLQPSPLGYANALPGLPEMNWETMGYAPFYAHPQHQFPYGDINHGQHQMQPQQQQALQWEFVHEDGNRPSMIRPNAQAHLAGHMMMARMTPSPPPTAVVLAPLRPRTPQDSLLSVPSPLNEMDYFLDDIDPRILPVKSWILENLLKALKKSASAVAATGAIKISCDELLEAHTTAHYSPADFHRLNSFLSLHDSREADAAIRVAVAPSQPGHAGWLLSGEDFVRVLPVPLDGIFAELRLEESGKYVDISQVYLMYDIKQHILTIRSVFTLSD